MNLCPTKNDLQGLLTDRLPGDVRTSVESHVEACPTCQRQLDALTEDTDLKLASPHVSTDRGPAFLERVQAQYPETLLNGISPGPTTLQFPGPPTDRAPLGQLGDFDILQELGSGSFGWVFRARERSLDRIVALKVLKPEMTARPDAVVRFEREAKKASLKHDHIVNVYRFEKPAAFPPYIVMEFVEGETLEAKLKRESKLTPEEAAAIARQVALGLAAAHEHGMVHRDIKPANILLDKLSGRAKISDFGLARDIANDSLAVTGAGELAGTAPYMSPEHFRSPEKVDGRSDLFSLGIVLYQMLTGQLPFKGSFLQIRSGILEDEPKSPRRLNDRVPIDLETITLACLEKDSTRRYATAQAAAEDLRRFQTGEPILCRPTGNVERAMKWAYRKPAQATLVGVGTFAMLALVGLVVGLFFNTQLQAINKDLTKAKGDLETTNGQLRLQESHVKQLNYVADMNLAHQAWQNDDFPLLEQYLAAHEKSELRGFEWHYLRWLANTDGRRIGPKEPVTAVAFDSTGARLALAVNVGAEVQIQLWSAPSKDKPADALLQTVGREKSIADLAFHPKGDLLVVSDREGSVGVWDVKKAQKVRAFAGAGPIAVSPDGQWLAYVLPGGMVQRWSFANQRDLGPPMPFDVSPDGDGADKGKGRNVKPGPRELDRGDKPGPRTKGSKAGEVQPRVVNGKFQDAGIHQLAFSQDGQRLAIAGGFYRSDGLVAVWDLVTSTQLALNDTRHSDIMTTVAFSPDGKSIAAAGYDHVLRVWDLKTGEMRVRRAGHKLEVLGLAFNFTGDLLASAGWDRTVKLWNPRTGEELRTLRGNRAVVRQVLFSPAPNEAGQDNLVSLNAADELRWWDASHEQSARVTPYAEPMNSLAFSPQGRYLAALGRSRAWIKDLAAEHHPFEFLSLAAGSRGAFSRDEAALFTAGSDGALQSWPFAKGDKAVDIPKGAALAGQRIILRMEDGWFVSDANPSAEQPLQNLLPFGPIAKDAGAIVAVDAAGERLAFYGDGNIVVRQRDKESGALIDKLLPTRANVNALAFSPDGRLLAVDNPDFSIALWDIEKGEQVHRLTGHLCVVGCIAFSPDGKRLVSGSEDWTVKLWDIDIGRATITLTGHKGRIRDVAFSPDGTLLASASEDGTVRVWPGK